MQAPELLDSLDHSHNSIHLLRKALWHHSNRLAFSTRGEELMDIAERQREADARMETKAVKVALRNADQMLILWHYPSSLFFLGVV